MSAKYYKVFFLLGLIMVIASCGTYFNQPIEIENARLGENSPATKSIKNLPQPVEPVVVGVYKFRDQTGQYKPTEGGSTFSTAVTQGATTILIKALEDSNWFVPIERENLSNLLNERNIIRSTRKEYNKNQNGNEPQLPPLLYAGIILEGGIVSYDTNIITGGLGARYFGVGASTQYRQDRITVYLRAVSTSSGKILKTVYVSKTILSQALDANFFRYVKFRRLLEAETGFTKNEPGQLAVSEAIEKAVEALILEGVEDDLWTAKASKEEVEQLLTAYKTEKSESENTGLYQRFFKERRGEFGLTLQGGAALINGDYNEKDADYAIGVGAKHFFNPYLNVGIGVNKFQLSNGQVFSQGFNALQLNTELYLLPFEKISPFAIGGIGIINTDDFSKSYVQAQYGLGVEYLVAEQWGISTQLTHNLVFSDSVDEVVQGKQDDQYFTIGFGLTYYFKKPLPMDKKLRKQERSEQKALSKLRKRNRKSRNEKVTENKR
ncbi:CsgG/HfaB family protein [Aquimarina brevivitae]|uniref:Curli production assembly/transport component CsgG n=1 Tax=Aquimarina brevivitae TaxID=323412 RepID=A0A4Q7PJ57_9FLAO|nr:CsgG/HfaB family protein [Aquimarina brevivitae]RZT00079.1 curli production assembly/transport component CsgG [Aquimarina brevivitae]